MKICNYCGTGMDNNTMKCPFCRMEMDIRGAVKYQDNRPFDPNMPAPKARDGKTPSELRYEQGLKENDFNRLKRHLDKETDISSKFGEYDCLEDETFDEEIYNSSGKSSDDSSNKPFKKAKSWEINIPKNQNNGTIPTIFKNFVTVFVLICVVVNVVFATSEIDIFDDEYDNADYIGTENFDFGIYEDGVYTNSYSGIKFDTERILGFENDAVDADLETDPDDLLCFDEFYVSDADIDSCSYMYITYINKDYWGCDTADEMVENEREYCEFEDDDGNSRVFVSSDMNYICGYEFSGFTTFTIYDEYDPDNKMIYYTSYMVADVTDDYFCVIEITGETFSDIERYIEGFASE